jgi:hypothetical protein
MAPGLAPLARHLQAASSGGALERGHAQGHRFAFPDAGHTEGGHQGQVPLGPGVPPSGVGLGRRGQQPSGGVGISDGPGRAVDTPRLGHRRHGVALHQVLGDQEVEEPRPRRMGSQHRGGRVVAGPRGKRGPQRLTREASSGLRALPTSQLRPRRPWPSAGPPSTAARQVPLANQVCPLPSTATSLTSASRADGSVTTLIWAGCLDGARSRQRCREMPPASSGSSSAAGRLVAERRRRSTGVRRVSSAELDDS